MNEKYLSKQDVQTNLAKADVIFITIGSNDLLNECKRVVQEILRTDTKFKSADEALASLKESVKKNPLLVLSSINALNNWDYNSFENPDKVKLVPFKEVKINKGVLKIKLPAKSIVTVELQ